MRLDGPAKSGRANAGRRAAALKWRGIHAHNLRLTPQLVEDLAQLIEQGVPAETACESVGVSRRSLDRWLAVGRTIEEPADPDGSVSDADLPYAYAAQRFRKARADFLIRTIQEALDPKTKWHRARTLLEVLRRRDAALWCAPSSIVQAPQDHGPVPDYRYL